MLKKLLLGFVALFVCSIASANSFKYCPGFYLGAQGGWGKADIGDGITKAIDFLFNQPGSTLASKDIDEGGWVGGRGYIGYNFVPFFSLETGFTYMPENIYRANGNGDIASYSFNLRYRTYAIDAVAKLTLPFAYFSSCLEPLSVFAKGGVAYVNVEKSGNYVINDSSFQNTATHEKFRPTIGAGLAYNITYNAAIDLSWMYISGQDRVSFNQILNGRAKAPIPTCNLYMIGLEYKFPVNFF